MDHTTVANQIASLLWIVSLWETIQLNRSNSFFFELAVISNLKPRHFGFAHALQSFIFGQFELPPFQIAGFNWIFKQLGPSFLSAVLKTGSMDKTIQEFSLA